MRLRDFPFINYGFEAGADDQVFDLLLLVGPLVIGVIMVLDRSLFTEVLAAAYIAVFVTYALYRGVQESRPITTNGQ